MSQPAPLPFVSIIVPVYNDRKRIGRCIESLLRQSYPADRREIIIVDNNSTDGTRDVIGRYPVTLLLNLRACVLMKERYPLTEFCISPDRKKDLFRFEAQVFDLKPLAHFVLGFPDDVIVIEGDPLKEQISLMIKKLLAK